MNAEAIGITLRQLREKKGKTLQEVANDLDIDVSTLSCYETGKRIPKDDIKRKIADYYKRSISGIFFAD
jgi:transcriptional regulator with XRE-family HTH domain